MEAKDLRIGNYLKCGVFLTKVSCINKDNYTVTELNVSEGEFNYTSEQCKIDPIELTEEWLLKFGFNYQEGKYWIDGLCVHTTDSRYYILQEQGRVFIKNVHQLQNLYFALTGKELTIKN